jgi:hypothetical protein
MPPYTEEERLQMERERRAYDPIIEAVQYAETATSWLMSALQQGGQMKLVYLSKAQDAIHEASRLRLRASSILET